MELEPAILVTGAQKRTVTGLTRVKLAVREYKLIGLAKNVMDFFLRLSIYTLFVGVKWVCTIIKYVLCLYLN